MRRLFAGVVMVWLGVSGCGPGGAPSRDSQAPAVARTFHWKLVTTWPRNLPGLGTAPEHLAESLRVMSDGRLDIKVYGAGELVPAFGVFDAVSEGTAEMGHGAAYYWRGKIPAAAMFATVPFGMTAEEMNGWLRYGGGLALWRELYRPFGLVPFPAGNTGVQMAGWFNKEIKSLADLQGLKMRIPGLGGEAWQRAGGVAVTLPGSEVFTAMQTGVIDATEWVGPYNDLAMGLQSVAKYYYYPGWHEPGATAEGIINQQAWDSLPPDLQKMVEVAMGAVNNDVLSEFTARNAQALKTLVGEHQVQVRRLPDDVIERLRKESRAVVAEMSRDNELAKRIYDSYMRFLEDARAYDAVAEQAYVNIR